MSYITPTELALLRQRPHSTKLWLSIYKPDTVLSGQVNDGSITIGETDITYDNGAGASANVRSGMTMLVGTSAGKSDVGRIRVRSATATVITVAANSHINWQDDLYLTVVDFYEIWPIFPRYLLQDAGYVTVYKDYDIPYSNQNETLGSFVCMGSHYAGWTGDDVYYTATGTVNVNDQSMSYAWVFDGGNPASSAVETPGLVNYAAAGHYTTRLTVTNATGTYDVGYRHISIYDKPWEGDNVPILRWEMDDLDGSRDEGGYSVTIRVFEDVDDIVDGSLVVLFSSDDYYGSTNQAIGGNSENRETIVFVGYILDGSIRYNYDPDQSYVEFTVTSPTGIMQTREVPAVSVSSASDPVTDANDAGESPWFWIKNMDVQKFLYHFMYWHSTILLTSDFRYMGTDFIFRDEETDPGSLYDAINSFFEDALQGGFTSDRQGLLWGEIEPQAIDAATGTFPVGMEILRQDWLDEPDILERTVYPLSYVEMGGVAYSGPSTGTYEAFISEAPGEVYGYMGKSEGIQGLILVSQTQLNILTGNYFAYENARYPEATFQFSGDYRNLDIAPIENYPITLYAGDTRRGFIWTRRPFHITDIGWSYSPKDQTFLPEVTLHEITQGYAGNTVPIPETPNPGPAPIPIIPGPIIPPFPIIPPPIGPPPIFVPPPIIPPGDDTCPFNLSEPPNGPFTIHFGDECLGVQRCYDIIGGNYCIIWNWTQMDFGNVVIRNSLADNPTYIEIDGCWDIIDIDSEAITDIWDDTSGIEISTNNGVPASPIETVGLDSAAGSRCEIRTATFDSNTGPYIASGIQIKVSDAQIECGGPVIMAQYNKGKASGGSASWGGSVGQFVVTSITDNSKAWWIWSLDTTGLSYPDGRLRATIYINDFTGNTVFLCAELATDWDASATPCHPGAGCIAISTSSTGTSVTRTWGGVDYSFLVGTNYFALALNDNGSYNGTLTITKLEWVYTNGNYVADLWEPHYCRRRLCINSVKLYNICPYDEDTFPP